MKNLYDFEMPGNGERFDTLFKKGVIEVVRIVSTSIDEPKNFRDERDEWVVLLQGEAQLAMRGKRIALKAGDTLYIPADTPHELISVSPGSLWLAFHFKTCE